MARAPSSPGRPKSSRSHGDDLPNEPPGIPAELAEIVSMILGGKEAVAGETARTVANLEDRVRHLASDTLYELKESRRSSSFVDAMDQLRAIRKLSLELQRKLGGMDDIVRSLLMDNVRGMQRPIRLVGKSPPPVPSAKITEDVISSADAVKPLEALARAADVTRLYIEKRATTASGAGLKQGGGNLRKRLTGDVRVHLAKECAKLLGEGQGFIAIGGTEGGKLHDLVTAVWTYATGLDSDEGGGSEMAKIVKRVAPEIRRIVQAQQEIADGPEAYKDWARLGFSEHELSMRLRQRPRADTSRPSRQGSKR